MSQSHLVIDFPIRAPANATALAEELPPLMPDFAKVQDELGTVHFSRFMIEGDEKLLFLSDIDDRGCGEHRAARGDVPAQCSTPSSSTWTTLPPRPWLLILRRSSSGCATMSASRSTRTSPTRTLRFRTSRRAARAAGFTGNTAQSTLLTYMSIKSRLQGFALKQAARSIREQGPGSVGRCRDAALLPLGALRAQPLGLLHDLRRRLREVHPGLRGQDSDSIFDAVLHACQRCATNPGRKECPDVLRVGSWRTIIRPSGSTAPIQASGFKTFEPCWPMIATSPSATTG